MHTTSVSRRLKNCIKKTEKHQAHPTTYNKLDPDPTHPIKNDALSTLGFLNSIHQVAHRNRTHLKAWKSSHAPHF